MPDISLLQREYDVAQEESRTPGVTFTIAITFFIVFIGAYVGLYLYNSFLTGETDAVNKELAKTKIGESFKNVDQLNSLRAKTNMLKSLRESHTSVSRTLLKVEQVTHPDLFFSSGDFDLTGGTVKLKGTVSGSAVLLRQVEIYMADKGIKDFKLENPAYAEKHSIAVNINLTLNK